GSTTTTTMDDVGSGSVVDDAALRDGPAVAEAVGVGVGMGMGKGMGDGGADDQRWFGRSEPDHDHGEMMAVGASRAGPSTGGHRSLHRPTEPGQGLLSQSLRRLDALPPSSVRRGGPGVDRSIG
ncbi:MAG: hypothetical protein M1826_005542, partial [Phylliscum demangeonii]